MKNYAKLHISLKTRLLQFPPAEIPEASKGCWVSPTMPCCRCSGA